MSYRKIVRGGRKARFGHAPSRSLFARIDADLQENRANPGGNDEIRYQIVRNCLSNRLPLFYRAGSRNVLPSRQMRSLIDVNGAPAHIVPVQ
jgi:hypothetical protein